MGFLASWIQQLILVVIMATFLDLLLPNNAMQRYVRLVMGLVILMLILSPLLTLLKNDWDINSVLQVEQETVGGELESMPQIEERVGRLQQQQQQWVDENVQKRVETEIEAAVEQQFDVPVEDVYVSLTDDDHQTAINDIVLTIDNDKSASEKIVAVDPIDIDVSDTQETKEAFSNEQMNESPQFTTIRKWLAQQWLVEESNIHIKRVGEEG
mgnify:CR=1 FL=1